jgi:hypothetical protein
VEGTFITPSGVSTATALKATSATSATSADTGDRKSRTPLGLILGITAAGLLIGAVVGALFFVHRRRRKAVPKPEVEAYHLDTGGSPPEPKSRGVTKKSMGVTPGVVAPTPSKGTPRLPIQPIHSPTTQRDVSTTILVSPASPPSHTPPPTKTERPRASVPPAPPIPRMPPPGTMLPPPSTPDHSSTPHPNRIPLTAPSLAPPSASEPTDERPLTSRDSPAVPSDSNTVVLRSEIEVLREQVRLLQVREATREVEFQSYEPPPQYSPRRPGHQSDDEDG